MLLDAIAQESITSFSDFDEDVVWTPAGGSATNIRGIFDYASDVQDIGEMIEMDGVAATLDIPDACAPGITRGDSVVLRGNNYRVISVQPTGTGRTLLVLGI